MKKKRKIKIAILVTICYMFLVGCSKKKPLGFVCFSDFKKDRIKISYANTILADTIITTNESIGIALLTDLYLDKSLNQFLYLSLNNVVFDSVLIENKLCCLLVNFSNTKFQIKKDFICKQRRIL
jgi:hypothetical protein